MVVALNQPTNQLWLVNHPELSLESRVITIHHVDTHCDSIDCTNDDEIISSLFSELFAFVSNWMQAWMKCLDSIRIATALW
jgi:hypothetical protein